MIDRMIDTTEGKRVRCPLNVNCLIYNIIYKTAIKEEGNNNIAIELNLKNRWYYHLISFNNIGYYDTTALFKRVMQIKDVMNKVPILKWDIIKKWVRLTKEVTITADCV